MNAATTVCCQTLVSVRGLSGTCLILSQRQCWHALFSLFKDSKCTIFSTNEMSIKQSWFKFLLVKFIFEVVISWELSKPCVHRTAMLEICHQRTPCTIKDHCQVKVLRNECYRYLLLLVAKMLAVKLDNKVQYRYGDRESSFDTSMLYAFSKPSLEYENGPKIS